MEQRGFLFDLDGVLVDTAVFHFTAWRALAGTLGFDIDEAFNETLKGISRMDSLDRILDRGGIEANAAQKEMWAKQKNHHYLELVQAMTPEDVLPGVRKFLEEAKAQNIPMALGSASKNARLILERTDIAKYLDAVIDGNEVTRSKPHPEVFIKGAAALHLAPEACVVFEDAFAGIEAGKAAGALAVGVGNPKDLPNADMHIQSFENVTPHYFLKE
jgi:beta-phosphoglucomutase